MSKKFPAYATIKAASQECWNCSSKMDEAPKDSGYPRGRGQYVMQCGKCRLFKFFDLKRAA